MRYAIFGGVMMLAAIGATSASAAPSLGGVSAPVSQGVVEVSEGCGPYGFRDAYGYCRQRRIRLPPPGYYGCPPGFRPTPYGCRRYY